MPSGPSKETRTASRCGAVRSDGTTKRNTAAVSATPAIAATATGRIDLRAGGGARDDDEETDDGSTSVSVSSRRTSLIELSRFFGSFSRQRRNKRRIGAGSVAGTIAQFGSSF